ncbi:MAG TPA: hypothetical protein VFJ08_14505 [Salinisphaera sp.]|nr:hypothetical protein [Salinisphaera sp.]HET7315559.1 hypothetical protein [Salinisphaera sp.]
MPRFAANLSTMFNEVGFMARFERAARAGFTGVEFLFPYPYDADEIARALTVHDLRSVLLLMWQQNSRKIGCFQRLAKSRPAHVRPGFDKASRLDAAAARLRGPLY